MVSLHDIKSDFPDWPDDVIDQWLLKLANQPGMGWPPPDPMDGHRWELLLTHPISWWKDVTWTLETRDCNFEKLFIDARKTMNSLYKALVEGEDNGFAGDNSPARLGALASDLTAYQCDGLLLDERYSNPHFAGAA